MARIAKVEIKFKRHCKTKSKCAFLESTILEYKMSPLKAVKLVRTVQFDLNFEFDFFLLSSNP